MLGADQGRRWRRWDPLVPLPRDGALHAPRVPLDDFVERLIVTRLAAPDAADLLEHGDRPDLGALRDERTRLSTSIRQAGDDEQDRLLGRAERVRLTKRANTWIAVIDEKFRSGVNFEPLRGRRSASGRSARSSKHS